MSPLGCIHPDESVALDARQVTSSNLALPPPSIHNSTVPLDKATSTGALLTPEEEG